MSASLRAAWKLDNLQRAWRWIRTNPERQFKSHFRELYSAYAIADARLLVHLKDRLDRGIYEPSRSCKLFVPKASGILRPFTLLTIEDQIVYQAMTNVVAENLWPKVKQRYNKQVFGHQYAGPSSTWFYRKWSDGYKAFNHSAEKAFAEGYIWAASFDLTAFYDSIDHNVLRHMLDVIGLDPEFCAELTKLLNRWTATTTQIYHNHGIPQGPLSSGMISEAVLRHFDQNFKSSYDVRYFRYVDDIRLFAKSEHHLRQALVTLDRLSKDIGLFPQSSKIDIHRIVDIKTELKTVSSPPEPALAGPIPDQKQIHKRIAELAPRGDGYAVSDPTRFKFLLAKASPSLRILERLWRVFDRAPHYYPQLSNYLQKFEKLPDSHADRLLDAIKENDLYSAIRASLIIAADDRFSFTRTKKLRRLLKPMWQPRVNSPELSDALWVALHRLDHLTDRQTEYALLTIKPGWLRMRLHFGMRWFDVDITRRDRLLNQSLRSDSPDVALAAAWLATLLDATISKPTKSINPLAKLFLREVGKIRRAGVKVCGIRLAIEEMIGIESNVNWKRVFGKNYRQAEAKLVTCKGYYKTNPTAWVNMLDVFNDLLVDALFQKDSSIGMRVLGNFGQVIGNARFKTRFPRMHDYVEAVHRKRLESELSHAVVKATQAPTGRVPFKWLKVGTRFMKNAVQELESNGF